MKRFSFILILFVSLLVFNFDTTNAAANYSVALRESVNSNNDATYIEQTLTFPSGSATNDISWSVAENAKDVTVNDGAVSFSKTGNMITFNRPNNRPISIKYTILDWKSNLTKENTRLTIPQRKFSPATINSHELEILVAGDDLASVVGKKPSETDFKSGNQVYIFNEEKSEIKAPITIYSGSTVQSKIVIKKKLENNTFWWQTEQLILPLDTSNQKSFIKKITPKPTNTKVDKDGNILVEFSLSPRKKIDVVAEIQLDMAQSITPDIEDSEALIEEIPKEISADYTSSSKNLPKSTINELGFNIDKLRKEPVIKIANDVTLKVLERSKVLDKDLDLSKRKANPSTLAKSSLDYSDDVVASLRAAGVPARLVGGYLVNGDNYRQHVWLEFFSPDNGWTPVDPWLMKNGSETFGSVYFDHVAMFLWGVNDGSPKNIADSIAVEYFDGELPNQKFQSSSLEVDKFVLLPGVSLVKSSVKMPAGIVHDGLLLATKNDTSALGSLAPFQEISIWRPRFGKDSFYKEKVTFGNGDGEDILEKFVTKQAQPNYFSIIPTVLLVLIILWLLIRIQKETSESLKLYKDESKDPIESIDFLDDLKKEKTKISVKVKK